MKLLTRLGSLAFELGRILLIAFLLTALFDCNFSNLLGTAGEKGAKKPNLGKKNGIVDTSPPSAPSSLSAEAISSSQVSISWAGSVDDIAVVGYVVSRDGVEIAGPLEVTHFLDEGLSAGTTYSYAIIALDAVGNRASVTIAAQTSAARPPDIDLSAPTSPGGFAAREVSSSRTLGLTLTSGEYGLDCGYLAFFAR